MYFLCAAILPLIGFANSAPLPALQPAAARVDAYGDPLPKHALLRLGTVRFTHNARIRATFVSPDSKTVLAIDEGGMVRIWEAATGKELSSFQLDTYRTNSFFVLSPDRKLLAGDSSIDLRLWDAATGKTVLVVEHAFPWSSRVHKPAFVPDGKTLIGLAATGQLVFREVATGKKINAVLLEKPKEVKGQPKRFTTIMYSDFSADATLVAGTGDSRTEVYVWSTKSGKLVQRLRGLPTEAGNVRFSPDGKLLAAGCEDGIVRLWQLASGKLVREHEGYCMYDFAFSPDGKLIFLRTVSAGFHAFELTNGKRVPRDFKSPNDAFAESGFGISPDGKLLVAHSLIGTTNARRLWLWEIGSGKLLGKGQDAPVPFYWRGAAYAADSQSIFMSNETNQPSVRTERYSVPSGKLLGTHPGLFQAVGSDGLRVMTQVDREICVWEIATEKVLWKRRASDGILGADLSADGSKVVIESEGKVLRVADAKTGTILKEYQPLPFNYLHTGLPGLYARDNSVIHSRNLKYAALIGVNGDVVTILDWSAGKTILTLNGTPAKQVCCLFAISPDALHFVGTEREKDDERLVLWHLPSGKREDKLPQGSFGAASPDGKYLCLWTGDGLVVWDIRNRRVINTLRIDQLESQVVFSHDSRMIATTGKSDVTVLEVATGKIRRCFEDPPSRVLDVQFAPDSRTLMSVTDTAVLVWDLAS